MESARDGRRTAVLAAVREILLVAGLFLAYELARLLATGHSGVAMLNAERVWDLERTLRLPSEAAVQDLVIDRHALLRLINSYYAYVHFPATALALIWMYIRRPGLYGWMRWTLAALTGLALLIHLGLPLAPPRMMAVTGLADTGHLIGPAVYGPPDTDQVSNQYAAMPSLHVGWAIAVAVALIVATRSRWRFLWLAHPVITLLVVVASGNHYWLDAIVAGALLAAVLLILPWPRRGAVREDTAVRATRPVSHERQPAESTAV